MELAAGRMKRARQQLERLVRVARIGSVVIAYMAHRAGSAPFPTSTPGSWSGRGPLTIPSGTAESQGDRASGNPWEMTARGISHNPRYRSHLVRLFVCLFLL
jgi:hypothetical protein